MCVPNKSSDLKKLSKYQSRGFKNFQTSGVDSDEKFKDVLSVSTDYTKSCFNYIDERFKDFQRSSAYKVLFGTTQPAHVIMIVAVATVACLWHPRREEAPVAAASRIVRFAYFGSFCMYLGSQFWMTFVSGLALYFNLPRHHFGDVQRVLFPKYFALNSALTFIILVIFTQSAQELHGCKLYQMIALAVSFIINLVIRLYLTPPLLRLIFIKNKIEKEAGVGMEVGAADVGALRNCPHYTKIHHMFRKVHMSIAIGNIITMGCTVFHLYYLCHSICML
ncbi:transmembrane protein 205 isoform X2 [Atheta coriaria]